MGPAPGLKPVATVGFTTASGATHWEAPLGTGPVVVWLTVCVWVILHCAPSTRRGSYRLPACWSATHHLRRAGRVSVGGQGTGRFARRRWRSGPNGRNG